METDIHLEKLVLRLLCSGTPQGPVKNVLAPLLSTYRWQDHVHQVIFKAVSAIPTDDPAAIQHLLPAKLTRMGFPDIDWEELFEPSSVSKEGSIQLVRQLISNG
jgi:hypothetical protein